MKHLFTIIVLIVNLTCFGQNKYNDWFDYNLKDNPKSFKESSLGSLTDFLRPDFKIYLNASVNSNMFLNEYYFDTLGLISKEFHKSILDTIGNWYDYSQTKILHYKDSIILINYFPDGQEAWREKRYLDKNEFVRYIIKDSPLTPDTMIYERDEYNRIIKVYRHFYHIDFGKIIRKTYELNENGDIICENTITESSYANKSDIPNFAKSIYTYHYIYDAKKNWIIRISIKDNEVSMITQREIRYE